MIPELEHIKQEELKNRVWIISVMIICLLIGIGFVIFYKPSLRPDNSALENKEREMKALELQAQAWQILLNEQSSLIESLKERDSLLLKEIVVTGNEIRKIKTVTHEKIKVFDRYGSNDWTWYYSELPDPE